MHSNKLILIFSLLLALAIFYIIPYTVASDHVSYYNYNDSFNSVNYTSYIQNANGGTNAITGSNFVLIQHSYQYGTWFLNHHLHLNEMYSINLTTNFKYVKDVGNFCPYWFFGFTTNTSISNPLTYQNFLGLSYGTGSGNEDTAVIIIEGGVKTTLYMDTGTTSNTYYTYNMIFNSTGFYYYRAGTCYYSNTTMNIDWQNSDIYFGGGNTAISGGASGDASLYTADICYNESVDTEIDNISVEIIAEEGGEIIEEMIFNITSETPRITIETITNIFIYSGINKINIENMTTHIFSGVNPLEHITIILPCGGEIIEHLMLLLKNISENIIETLTIIFYHVSALIESISIILTNAYSYIEKITIYISGLIPVEPPEEGGVLENLINGAVVLMILILPTLMIREAFGNISIFPSLMLMSIVCFLGQLIPLWLMIFMEFMLLIIMFRDRISNRVNQ